MRWRNLQISTLYIRRFMLHHRARSRCRVCWNIARALTSTTILEGFECGNCRDFWLVSWLKQVIVSLFRVSANLTLVACLTCEIAFNVWGRRILRDRNEREREGWVLLKDDECVVSEKGKRWIKMRTIEPKTHKFRINCIHTIII